MARIKLSAAQAIELINQLGADVELVDDKHADSTLKFDEAISSVDQSRIKILKPNIESEIKESLTSSLAGKFGGDLRANLRRLSNGQLKTSDLKDLKDDEAIQKFLDVMIGQKDSSLEEIRNQQRTQLQEWETEKNRIISEKDSEFSKLKSLYTERDIDSYLENALNEIPRIGGNIKAQTQLAKSFIRSKYKDHYDDSNKLLELRDLVNPDKLALNGNVAVSIKDALTEFAKEAGILKTDMRNEDPTKFIAQDVKTGNQNNISTRPGSYESDIKSLEAQIMQ